MATVSSSSTGQRSRFSKLLLRSNEREREPSPSTPPPPPPPKDLSPPASHSSRSLPRTSSPTSRFRRPHIPAVQPSNSSSYSFTSSPSLQGGPNSPTLQEFEDVPKPSSSSSSHLSPTHKNSSSLTRGLPPPPPPRPTITTTPAASIDGPSGGGGGSSKHLKGKKSWTLLKRPGSSTNLSFRSVENEELQPQRYPSSSLPPRATSPGWNNGDAPILVPLSDEPKERAATLGRKSSNAQQLKRKGSRILRSASSTLLGVMGGGGGGAGGTLGGMEGEEGSPRELESRRRKNSSTSENGVLLNGTDPVDDGGIGMPFNIHHELHLESDDLSALPSEWVELLRAQGLSTTELLRLAKDKSKSQLARAAALNVPISPSSNSIRSLTSSPTKPIVPSTPPQLPPFSHTFLTPESPPPPPPPPRPDLSTKVSSRLSLQLRDFKGIEVFAREETDGGWAQGLLSAALGGGGGEPQPAAAASDSGSSHAGSNLVASPSEERPPHTPREQRSSRLAKKGVGRRPSDPPSAGEGGDATSRSTSPKTSSTFSHGASSSGGTNHPITPLPPPGSYVPPARKDSRPDAQRSNSVSSFGSSTEAASPAVRITTAPRPPPAIPLSVQIPTISPVSRALPLLPAPLLTTVPLRRPLPSVPVDSSPPPPTRSTTPPTRSPPRAIPSRKVSTSSSSGDDEPRSNTFGTLSGALQGGRRTPDALVRPVDATTKGRRNGQREKEESSDEEGGGLAYLDEFGAGGDPAGNGGGTFGQSTGRRASNQLVPLERTTSNSSQTSTTSFVPSLNGDASIPTSHSNSSIRRRPSLGMRNSSSYNSTRTSNLDARLSVMTAATGTSRVTSLSPSMISSGSHMSMDEEAVITRAFLVPSSSSASATTTQFASSSMNRPTKPVRLFLGGSNGSSRGTTSSSPPPPNRPYITKSSSSDVAKSLSSAGSQQSMFEEAELALDKAVKMLNSPKKYKDSPTMRGGGGGGDEADHPTTPGTPAYSDFLHQFGSDDEDGFEQEVSIQRRRP